MTCLFLVRRTIVRTVASTSSRFDVPVHQFLLMPLNILIPIWIQSMCQSWTIRRRCRITKCCLTRLDVLTCAVWPAARAHSNPFLVGGIECKCTGKLPQQSASGLAGGPRRSVGLSVQYRVCLSDPLSIRQFPVVWRTCRIHLGLRSATTSLTPEASLATRWVCREAPLLSMGWTWKFVCISQPLHCRWGTYVIL